MFKRNHYYKVKVYEEEPYFIKAKGTLTPEMAKRIIEKAFPSDKWRSFSYCEEISPIAYYFKTNFKFRD